MAQLDSLNNLDLTDPAQKDKFYNTIYDRLEKTEGHYNYAYNDDEGKKRQSRINKIDELRYSNGAARGNITVGRGFNMGTYDGDRDGARKLWNEAFKDEKNPPDFGKVKLGEQDLTDAQIRKLTNPSIENSETIVKRKINGSDSSGTKFTHPGAYQNLPPSTQAALIDMDYNSGGAMLNEKNSFNIRQDMRNYATTGDKKYLKDAQDKTKKFGEDGTIRHGGG